MSQRNEILEALKQGETLTPLDALQRFGCFRLAARISDLKADGYQIETIIECTNTGKRIAHYRMEAKWLPSTVSHAG